MTQIPRLAGMIDYLRQTGTLANVLEFRNATNLAMNLLRLKNTDAENAVLYRLHIVRSLNPADFEIDSACSQILKWPRFVALQL